MDGLRPQTEVTLKAEFPRLRNRGQTRERHGYFFRWILVILKLAGLVVDIGLHVEVAMATEIEENRTRLSFGFGLESLANCLSNGVIGFGSRNDTLRTRKLNTRRERVQLLNGYGVGQP